jgi:hypothetical protein
MRQFLTAVAFVGLVLDVRCDDLSSKHLPIVDLGYAIYTPTNYNVCPTVL